jgi:hypothetical protein
MERLPGCVCERESACEECLPVCDYDSSTYEKNRWATMLEALTGTWPDFRCEAFEREDPDIFSYDRGYFLPYHQPWQCDPLTGTRTEPCANTETQNEDGILDAYRATIRFGMATYDSIYTYAGSGPMLPDTEFDFAASQDANGLWSYGPYSTEDSYPFRREDGSVVGQLKSPDMPSASFLVDTGIRGKEAAPGALTSPFRMLDMEVRNQEIQNGLLGIRPYGGSPIAAAFDDLYYFFKNDPAANQMGESAASKKYLLLITEGVPDDDFRRISACDCATETECCEAYNYLPEGDSTCKAERIADRSKWPRDFLGQPGVVYDPDEYQCPYPMPEESAAALLKGYDGEGGVIDGLFVLGFSVPCPDPPDGSEGCEAREILNAIARAAGADEARFADTAGELRGQIETVISDILADTGR